jgi:hypothetical protein
MYQTGKGKQRNDNKGIDGMKPDDPGKWSNKIVLRNKRNKGR